MVSSRTEFLGNTSLRLPSFFFKKNAGDYRYSTASYGIPFQRDGQNFLKIYCINLLHSPIIAAN